MRKIIAMLAVLLFWADGQASAQQARSVVAIYQMDDLATTGQAQVFSTMIATAIAASNKFRVIERTGLNKLVQEQMKGKSGMVTTSHRGRIGGFEGADYLIYGSITSLTAARKTDLGTAFLSGMVSGSNRNSGACWVADVTLSVDIKIIDADSGEVRYVRRINEVARTGVICGANPPSFDTATLFRSAAEKIATGLVTTVYPIQVAAVQSDGVIVLNYGEGAVKVGDLMSVFVKGAVIRDPATGEILANDERRIGGIRVTDVLGRVSKAVQVGLFTASPAVGYIARPANAEEAKAMTSIRKRNQ